MEYRLFVGIKTKRLKAGLSQEIFCLMPPQYQSYELRSAWKTSVAPFEDKNACIAEEMFLVAVY